MSVSVRHPGDNERRYLFTRQVQFSANKKLAVERSNNFTIPKPIPEQNIWKKKPPDFSLRLYKSLNLPRRSEENKVKETLKKNVMEVIRDAPPPPREKSKEPDRFLTRFKPMEPIEASISYVKNGVYPKDKYKDPRPHDFRQVRRHYKMHDGK